MKILIFGITIRNAINKLEEILSDMRYGDVFNVRRTSNDMSVELFNGDIYKTVTASQYARGYKCHKAYIQNGIDKEIHDCVILPTLCRSDLPKEEQVVYFD